VCVAEGFGRYRSCPFQGKLFRVLKYIMMTTAMSAKTYETFSFLHRLFSKAKVKHETPATKTQGQQFYLI
jgi:hypothetical protein